MIFVAKERKSGWPTRTRTLNDGTKNRSVAITPSGNSPLRDGKYSRKGKMQKDRQENFAV